jgi:ABC-2 type transport system ATP-binding protein
MQEGNAIEVRDVHKYFKVYKDKGNALREKVVHPGRNKYEIREVLKGISFDVKKGECVGLIGKNGCGKSTTLKLLTKILEPNSGTVEHHGRLYSLIELGAGFHPDMSGRENIYINASIFGLTHEEVDERLDEIIDFSELEEFIDSPVRTYSSGMYMRLAFSVAINIDADILLIDEILAVGDDAFQKKCFNKLFELKRSGKTIVIVSHSLGQIESICDRAIWINNGQIAADGSPASKICDMYIRESEKESKNREKKKADEIISESGGVDRSNKKLLNATCREIAPDCGVNAERRGTGGVEFTNVRMIDFREEDRDAYSVNDRCRIHLEYQSQITDDVRLKVEINRTDWVKVFSFNSDSIHVDKDKKYSYDYILERMGILAGQYNLSVAVYSSDDEELDVLDRIIDFKMVDYDDKVNGLVYMDYRNEVREIE